MVRILTSLMLVNDLNYLYFRRLAVFSLATNTTQLLEKLRSKGSSWVKTKVILFNFEFFFLQVIEFSPRIQNRADGSKPWVACDSKPFLLTFPPQVNINAHIDRHHFTVPLKSPKGFLKMLFYCYWKLVSSKKHADTLDPPEIKNVQKCKIKEFFFMINIVLVVRILFYQKFIKVTFVLIFHH